MWRDYDSRRPTANVQQFTGRENDGSLYLYRGRYDAPQAQRFVSEDPAEFAGGDVNLNVYVKNNPTRYRDPFGRDPVIGAAVGAIAGGFYGGMGAYLAGGSAAEIAAGAAIGAGLGAGVGALDPTLGAATLAVVGGFTAGAGDVAGQLAAGRTLRCINWGSTIGATAGGAFAGAGGASLGVRAIVLELPELPTTAGISALTSPPGAILPAVGGELWPKNPHCGCR